MSQNFYNAHIKSQGAWAVSITLIQEGLKVGFIRLQAEEEGDVRRAILLLSAQKPLPHGVKLLAVAKTVPRHPGAREIRNDAVIGEVTGDGEVILFKYGIQPQDDSAVRSVII